MAVIGFSGSNFVDVYDSAGATGKGSWNLVKVPIDIPTVQTSKNVIDIVGYEFQIVGIGTPFFDYSGTDGEPESVQIEFSLWMSDPGELTLPGTSTPANPHINGNISVDLSNGQIIAIWDESIVSQIYRKESI